MGSCEYPQEKLYFRTLKQYSYSPTRDLRFVQDWLGHANTQNTVIYVRIFAKIREAKAQQFFTKLTKFSIFDKICLICYT
jgi:hypothetical protein